MFTPLWKLQIPYKTLRLVLWIILLFLEQRLEIVVLENRSIYGVLVRSQMLLVIDRSQTVSPFLAPEKNLWTFDRWFTPKIQCSKHSIGQRNNYAQFQFLNTIYKST